MSTAEPLAECEVPESSQQSSGVLNFILSKLGRHRNGSKGGPAVSGMSGSDLEGALACKAERGEMEKADYDEEEVQSFPKPAVVPDDFDLKGRRGRRGGAGIVPLPTPGQEVGPSDSAAFLDATSPVENRSASDTAAWDFRRKEKRRNSRSAREWVRESNVQAPASDWSKDLAKYDPDAKAEEDAPSKTEEDAPTELTAAPSDAGLVPTHFEEGGMRFRRRSRSAKELAAPTRDSVGHVDPPRARMSLENVSNPHGSKRSSFEAGLSQNLKAAAGTPKKSTEKIRRQGNTAKKSDFLPDELIQRSQLFNTRSTQPQE